MSSSPPDSTRGLTQRPEMRRWLIAVAALALAVTCTRQPQSLTLSTTTTVENSGLLGALLPEFEKATGIKVNALSASNPRALDVLDRGDADVGLTHDPDAEEKLIKQGRIGLYRKVMFNDFVIVGPRNDPAGLTRVRTAVEAMAAIAAAGAPFVSRGDSSGIHAREMWLWQTAGRKPLKRRYIETAQSMAATLRVASERQAYVLTDRTTFRQMESGLKLRLVFEGDPALLNTYSVLYTSAITGQRLERARRFVQWMADGAGRDVIAHHQVKGQRIFSVWPTGENSDNPRDIPDAR